MNILDKIWKNHENDLPFNPNINENLVLDAIINMSNNEKQLVKEKVQQWIKFNKGLNVYEEETYQTWVSQIYSQINFELDSVSQTN
tara:strand:+ start:404 stop:661 length:258 start_codon:yes stop_codon:yes gene_type:complete